MAHFFAIIFVLASITLVVGLFKPIWFRLKDRKQVGKIFGGTCVVSFVALAIVVPKPEKQEPTKQAVIKPTTEMNVHSPPKAQQHVQEMQVSQNPPSAQSVPDQSEVKELKVIYAHLNRLHTELENEFNRLPKHRQPSSQVRRNWGQFSNGWNQNLKMLRTNGVLKNPGMLNLKSVTDKTKNSIEAYGSNLFLYWQVMNDRLNGKKTEQFQLDSLNEDVQQATADSSKGLALLEKGVDDLKEWGDD